ncbi:MAG: hypothetical protein MUC78_01670 [Bacteroidales bacterium]|jgi:hypothetical protein|nr:hypothetical protein [Bacteroidales bacterium]
MILKVKFIFRSPPIAIRRLDAPEEFAGAGIWDTFSMLGLTKGGIQ